MKARARIDFFDSGDRKKNVTRTLIPHDTLDLTTQLGLGFYLKQNAGYFFPVAAFGYFRPPFQ